MVIPYDIESSFKLPYGLSLEYDNIKLIPLNHLCCLDIVGLYEE
jgi:hypothetical protein